MIARLLIIAGFLFLLLCCKKDDIVDPDQRTQSYISFLADGKPYRIENGAENEYIQFRFGEEPGSLRGNILEVGGRDSVTVVPTFALVIRSDNAIRVGKFVNSTDTNRSFESSLQGILPRLNLATDYAGYWSSSDATIEVTEVTGSKITGNFSGIITSKIANSPNKSIQITEGRFFVNRRLGYTTPYRF